MMVAAVTDKTIIANLWPQIAPCLQMAINTGQGELTVETVRVEIEECRMQLWVVFDDGVVIAACTTTLLDTPTNKRICRIVLLGGSNSRSWGAMLDDWLTVWARANGCHCVEAFVTDQMYRHLKKVYGYKPLYHVVGRNLWNESGVLH